MNEAKQKTQKRFVSIMMRDVPLALHNQIKKLSAARGMPMKALLLELARREYQLALEKGEVAKEKKNG